MVGEIYPQSDDEMSRNAHNSLLSDIYNSIKVYADGVELPLIKSLTDYWEDAEAVVILYTDEEEMGGWWKLILRVPGDAYDPPYDTIRVCAVHPVELETIAV